MPFSASGTATVPCPEGKKIKILAAFTPGSPAEGGQAFLTYSHGSQPLWEGATQPTTLSMTHVTWGIGNTAVIPRQDIVDPATGVVTYSQGLSAMSAGLVDAWWPFEVQVASSLVPGQSFSTIVYATADLD